MGKSRKPTKTRASSAQGRNGMDSFSYYKFREAYKNIEFSDLQPDYGVHGEGILDDFVTPTPIDLWHEKPYFGRYDLNANAVYVLERNLTQLHTENTEDTILAVNFVVDAFQDLQRHFSQALTSRKIKPSFTLSNLPVAKGHVSPDSLHQEYINNLFEVFVLSYLEGNDLHRKIRNFSDFMKHFTDFFKYFGYNLPFTFSGFLGSKRCPSNVCGLILDMQSQGFSDDSKKVNNFLAKDEFSFYMASARAYGFMVDKNSPWRLVADVSSPQMKEYMMKYDTNLSENNIFEKYYVEAYAVDIEIMLKNIVSYYNNYITSRPYTSKTYHAYSAGDVGTTKEKMRTITRNTVRQKTSLKDIFRTYGIDDIMDFYFTIKCYEVGADQLLKDKESIISEAISRRKSLGLSFALSYLNGKITDTIKINLTIGTEYVKGNNEKARRLLNYRQPQNKEPNIRDVISGDYNRK
jgi:hypothetical protein